jgi:hypothetical protein
MRPNCKNNLSASAAADAIGIVIPAQFVLYVSAQAVVTGTSTGTLNIEASNDVAPPVDSSGNPNPTNWSIITTLGTVSIAGAGIYLIPKFDVCYQYIRAHFLAGNDAAGTISVNLNTIGF